MINYGLLKKKHEKYDAEYWQELRTLAYGGNYLDEKILKKLLPKQPGEESEVYKHRIKMAYFTPYMGSMLGYYSSSVISDPLIMNTDDKEDMPEFYKEFEESVCKTSCFNISINEHVRMLLNDAFYTKVSYALVDLPALKEGEEAPKTKAEEEARGLDKAYVCAIPAEEVWNYQEDEDGKLLWINIHSLSRKQLSILDDKITNIETFTLYYPEHWERYTYQWKDGDAKPLDNQPPNKSDMGEHSFERVPVEKLTLPDDLYFGDKIGSLMKKIFQKMNGLDYASDKTLFQFLLWKHQNMGIDAPSIIAENENRATDQTFGNGRVIKAAEKDVVEYVGGSPEPLAWTENHIRFLRDEASRIIGQSALNLTGSSKLLNRSADSKSFDKKSMEIIEEHLGLICKEYAERVFELVAAGRKEKLNFRASGMADYSQIGIDELADIQTKVSNMELPSTTFNAEFAYNTVKMLLEDAPKEKLEIIEKELIEGYKKNMQDVKKGDTNE